MKTLFLLIAVLFCFSVNAQTSGNGAHPVARFECSDVINVIVPDVSFANAAVAHLSYFGTVVSANMYINKAAGLSQSLVFNQPVTLTSGGTTINTGLPADTNCSYTVAVTYTYSSGGYVTFNTAIHTPRKGWWIQGCDGSYSGTACWHGFLNCITPAPSPSGNTGGGSGGNGPGGGKGRGPK
jgi:hypothetical protein